MRNGKNMSRPRSKNMPVALLLAAVLVFAFALPITGIAEEGSNKPADFESVEDQPITAQDDRSNSSQSDNAHAASEFADESDVADTPDNDNPDDGDAFAEDDPDDAAMPAQTFKEVLRDEHDNIIMTVLVEAPEGAFPVGTTMVVKEIAADDVEKIAEKVEGAIQDDPGIEGAVKSMTAVDICFLDADGNEIEPAKTSKCA